VERLMVAVWNAVFFAKIVPAGFFNLPTIWMVPPPALARLLFGMDKGETPTGEQRMLADNELIRTPAPRTSGELAGIGNWVEHVAISDDGFESGK